MKQRSMRQIWKKGLAAGLSAAMAVTLLPAIPATAEGLSEAASTMPFIPKAGSISVSEEHATYDEPFRQGTAGCKNFRIPALITLQDGTLLATADARWETTGDGGGIDSIASISEDGGRTWQYSFPLFFPDSQGYAGRDATTIIDPGVVEGPDGTIYFIADVNPTGSTTMYKTIGQGTGYVEVDNGVDKGRYLALTKEYGNVETKPTDDNMENYPYYVSDLNADGYASIRKRSDGSESGFGVDEWYNLYTIKDEEYVNDLTQRQVNEVNGERKEIQQNAFYKDSSFHVYSIDYLWVITSKDGGKTWEHPRDLTDQVKRHTGEHALLVSPGQGITTSTGDIVIGFYDHGVDEENASLVYSTDNGETWERTEDMQRTQHGGFWTSENEVVELWDGTLRMFARNGRGKICYADITKNEDGGYTMSEQSVQTEVSVTSTCNVSAISYSKPVNGKQLVLVTTPTGGSRAKGKIFAFLVEEDNSMTLFHTFDIPGAESGYVYSCLTEMEDGTIALLWEPNKWGEGISMFFDTFSILDIVPNAAIGGAVVNVEAGKGETFVRTYGGTGDFAVETPADDTVATVTQKKDGSDKVIEITGVNPGYTETMIDNVLYRIKITDNTVYMNPDEEAFYIDGVLEAPEEITDGPVRVTYEENGGIALSDHVSNTANSLDSFSQEVNRKISYLDAEFTMQKSGSNWSVYNEATGKYLVNTNGNSFFGDSPADIKLQFVNGDVRICNGNGQRYICFYYPNMDFNSNSGGYKENYADGSQELLLLEKQERVSASDAIPGYAKATEVKEGKKYLIAYHWRDEAYIILYPTNGTAAQTKMVRAAGRVTVAPQETGEVSVTIEGEVYSFKVTAACEHTETKVTGAIEKGCLTKGYTGDTYCANPDCGRLIEEGSVILAHGSHDWGEGKVLKEITATENGEVAYTCQRDSFHKKTALISARVYEDISASVNEELDMAISQAEEWKDADGSGLPSAIWESFSSAWSAAQKPIEETGVLQIRVTAENLSQASQRVADAKAAKDDLDRALTSTAAIIEIGRVDLPMAAWRPFSEAYRAAKGVQDAIADATVEDMRQKAADLVAEKNKIENTMLPSVKESLTKEVERVQTECIAAGEAAYTPDTWAPFFAAYNAAAEVEDDADLNTIAGLLVTLRRCAQELKKADSQDKPGGDTTPPGGGTTNPPGGGAVINPQPQPPADTLSDGYTETVGGISYKALSASAKTATVTGASGATVNIPAEVTLKNVSCKVTEIAPKAFAKSKKLKKVTIGGNVVKIGAAAFTNCKKLKSLTIQSKLLTSIQKGAFKKTPSNITVKAPGLNAKQKKNLLKKLKTAGMNKKIKIK